MRLYLCAMHVETIVSIYAFVVFSALCLFLLLHQFSVCLLMLFTCRKSCTPYFSYLLNLDHDFVRKYTAEKLSIRTLCDPLRSLYVHLVRENIFYFLLKTKEKKKLSHFSFRYFVSICIDRFYLQFSLCLKWLTIGPYTHKTTTWEVITKRFRDASLPLCVILNCVATVSIVCNQRMPRLNLTLNLKVTNKPTQKYNTHIYFVFPSRFGSCTHTHTLYVITYASSTCIRHSFISFLSWVEWRGWACMENQFE